MPCLNYLSRDAIRELYQEIHNFPALLVYHDSYLNDSYLPLVPVTFYFFREDLGSLDFPDISKQALSKARQFINPALFKELYYLSVDLFYKQLPSRKLWNGYHLFAIDGSKIELPNSKSNFEFFGEMFGYPDPSRRFTMGLGSIVYDVLDDYIVHASFQRYLASERSAALEHLHNLEDLNIYQNSVVIFDRGYYSEDMFRYCVEHQHPCLMRLKQNYNIAKKCSGDIITVLPGNEKDGT